MNEKRFSYRESFDRTFLLLGEKLMGNLKMAHVSVIGLGAVGSHALEALCRMGIGTVRIVDFDVLRPSNINRQLLALQTTLGKKKTEVAFDRIKAINPECTVEIHEKFFHSDTFKDIFKEPTDFVIDAIDGLSTKTLLIKGLFEKKIPFISSMGAANKLDPMKIRIGDLSEAQNCPLAKRIRKRLKKFGIQKGIRCVYSAEPPRTGSGTPLPEEEEILVRGRQRQPIGSISFITGIFGYMAAAEAFHYLTREQSGCIQKAIQQ
ncbi:MAG: tRNA threonylcarbamoyladenosine dehydratase [Spirochaetales bacterium]|nr:tRNA threonylcarbamoyladenosine dehydratase [Spirochaetales bacterium]